MKGRVAAAVLMGFGLSLAAGAPAIAAVVSGSGLAAAHSAQAGMLTRVGGYGRTGCFELPVVGQVVAFAELLSDDEYNYHCGHHYFGEAGYDRDGDARASDQPVNEKPLSLKQPRERPVLK
jgi:hypothetical protein